MGCQRHEPGEAGPRCRYAKGWGPDELAGRAEISRTALYQIECGKTELPRAGTLRRIAQALEVSVDLLLGESGAAGFEVGSYERDELAREAHFADHARNGHPAGLATAEDEELLPTTIRKAPTAREHELARKFQELLASPLGESVARIVLESHRILAFTAQHRAD